MSVRQISRSASLIGGLTGFSRVLGLIRTQIFSYFFGASLQADAFNAAFALPNTFRYLLGEGSLTPAVVAIFSRTVDAHPRAYAQRLAGTLFALLSLLLLVLSIGGIVAAPWYIHFYVPRFQEVPGKLELTITLTQILFPYLALLSLAALTMGILHSVNHFGSPALAPSVQNGTVILLSLLLLPIAESSILLYAAIILGAGALELLIQLPALRSHSLLPIFSIKAAFPEVRELMRMLPPSIWGLAVYQLNVLIGKIFASGIPGGVSHISYAELLIQLPLSLFAISFGTALVPVLSRHAAAGDTSGLRTTLGKTARLVGALIFPSVLALCVLAEPIVSVLFFYGAFTPSDLRETASVLRWYAPGLLLFAQSRLLVPTFYAMKDTATPAAAATAALLTHALGCYWLTPALGTEGIVLSLSISSFVNVLVLWLGLKYRIGTLTPSMRYAASLGLALCVMTGVLLLGIEVVPADLWANRDQKIMRVGALCLYGVMGSLSYFATLVLCQLPEAREILTLFRRRFFSNSRPA